MMRYKKINYCHERENRWVVAVTQRFTGTNRQRKIFTSKDEVYRYIDAIYEVGYTKADWRFGNNNGDHKPSAGTLKEWLYKYLAELHSEGKLITWRSKRHTLRRLERKLGNHSINLITRDDMLAWMRTIKGAPTTRKNHQKHASAFFAWCLDLDEPPIVRSPIRNKDRIRPEHKDPFLLTPEQFAACIEWAKQYNELEVLAHLCIGGFQGVRGAEIIRMSWQDLDWKNNKVHVLGPKRVLGARPRHPDMKDGLRKHLQPFALEKGAILPRKDDVEDKATAVHLRLGRLRKPMLKAVGISVWPRNTLRHSFKSYSEQVYGFDQTQRDMGHTNPKMTRYGYGADMAGGFWVTEEMAKRWFAV
jgi:integrase